MKMTKALLLASASVMVLGLGATSAKAFDDVDWEWNKTVTSIENITINVDDSFDITTGSYDIAIKDSDLVETYSSPVWEMQSESLHLAVNKWHKDNLRLGYYDRSYTMYKIFRPVFESYFSDSRVKRYVDHHPYLMYYTPIHEDYRDEMNFSFSHIDSHSSYVFTKKEYFLFFLPLLSQ